MPLQKHWRMSASMASRFSGCIDGRIGCCIRRSALCRMFYAALCAAWLHSAAKTMLHSAHTKECKVVMCTTSHSQGIAKLVAHLAVFSPGTAVNAIAGIALPHHVLAHLPNNHVIHRQ